MRQEGDWDVRRKTVACVATKQVDIVYHPETAVYPWLQQVTVD